MFVDTHAHLYFENFDGDLDKVIENSRKNGIEYIIVPSIDIKSAKKTLEIIEKYDNIYGAVGVHPHETKEWNENWLKEIEEFTKHEKIVAIGEIGLDYYYDFSPKEKQIKAFKSQIELAIKLDLPIIVHNRDSDEDMMKIIKEYEGTNLRAQFHCFNGSLDDAREYIRMHHMVSFTGNITFKKADDLRNIAKNLSLNSVMLETDSPFLTPVPNRGKRNEPSNVLYIAEKLAEISKFTLEDVARTTTYNVFKFFGIGNKPKPSYTYQIGKNLYINITNRCNADCVFCNRKGDAIVKGYNLKMNKSEEPPAEEYIKEIDDPKKYNEIVFCGYGEPTIRWDVVKKIAKYVKENGGRTRLDTDGHGNYINKKDITPELKNLIDIVSISLNATDAEQYSEIMRVDKSMFEEMKDFAKKAKQYVDKVVMSIVSIDEIDENDARKIAEEEIGAEFRVRPYF